jgi:hypothetical protein
MQSPEQAIGPNTVAVATVQGPAWQMQINTATINAPGTIAASGTFTSPVLGTYGNPHIAISAELSNAGTLSLQRYLDNAGSLAIGAATTLALTAGTLGVLDNLGTVIAQSFQFAVINGSAVAGTLTNVAAVLQSR